MRIDGFLRRSPSGFADDNMMGHEQLGNVVGPAQHRRLSGSPGREIFEFLLQSQITSGGESNFPIAVLQQRTGDLQSVAAPRVNHE